MQISRKHINGHNCPTSLGGKKRKSEHRAASLPHAASECI